MFIHVSLFCLLIFWHLFMVGDIIRHLSERDSSTKYFFLGPFCEYFPVSKLIRFDIFFSFPQSRNFVAFNCDRASMFITAVFLIVMNQYPCKEDSMSKKSRFEYALSHLFWLCRRDAGFESALSETTGSAAVSSEIRNHWFSNSVVRDR
jgi:hypothetical protein